MGFGGGLSETIACSTCFKESVAALAGARRAQGNVRPHRLRREVPAGGVELVRCFPGGHLGSTNQDTALPTVYA